MYIMYVSFAGCGGINFAIILIFLIDLFLYIRHKTWYNLKQIAAYSNIKTRKREGVPVEFKSLEKERGIIELIWN